MISILTNIYVVQLFIGSFIALASMPLGRLKNFY